MGTQILFLYGATVIIWGTTWLAIKFQLGSVDPMVSFSRPSWRLSASQTKQLWACY
jgi:hypothetical protein